MACTPQDQKLSAFTTGEASRCLWLPVLTVTLLISLLSIARDVRREEMTAGKALLGRCLLSKNTVPEQHEGKAPRPAGTRLLNSG